MGVGDLNRDPANDKSEITDSDEEKAQIFADYFSSVFTQEPLGPIPFLENKLIKDKMTDLRIEEIVIKKQQTSWNQINPQALMGCIPNS